MAMDVTGLVAAADSHLFASGRFRSVSRHEPTRPPGKGVTAAVWLTGVAPIQGRSGLASTSGRVELRVRLYMAMLREPVDAIDPDMLRTLDALMTAYSADFTLDGRVAAVDLLGAWGSPLSSLTGYLQIGNTLYRVADITLPLIVDDLWGQAA